MPATTSRRAAYAGVLRCHGGPRVDARRLRRAGLTAGPTGRSSSGHRMRPGACSDAHAQALRKQTSRTAAHRSSSERIRGRAAAPAQTQRRGSAALRRPRDDRIPGGCRTNHSAFRCINWSWDTTIRIVARIADLLAVPKLAPVIWTASPTLDNSTYFRGFIRRPPGEQSSRRAPSCNRGRQGRRENQSDRG